MLILSPFTKVVKRGNEEIGDDFKNDLGFHKTYKSSG